MRVTLRRLAPLAIVLTGFALRLHQLGAQSLWYDETVSVYLAGSPLKELLRHTAGDIHPPGYYLLLRAWLILTGYPTGHADPKGWGLEFASAFFSLFFGVLLIALVYALGRWAAGARVATLAAGFVALSPYNVWYSQEVRMYTLAAVLGTLCLYAVLQATALDNAPSKRHSPDGPVVRKRTQAWMEPRPWWVVYALASAAGMYTLYYFAFLLAPLSLWALARVTLQHRTAGASAKLGPTSITSHGLARWRRLAPWATAHLAALLLYLPWVPIAWRQATQPPVPPWRSLVAPAQALVETWSAFSLGPSMPASFWPVLLIVLVLCGLGLAELRRPPSIVAASGRNSLDFDLLAAPACPMLVASLGPLAFILLASRVASPLYHVRYMFAYTPAFSVLVGAGLAWLARRTRLAAGIAAVLWLAAAAASLEAFWTAPEFRPDDLRGAVETLQATWRPGDAVLVNAGYTYPALLTYWQGPVAANVRLSGPLPLPRADAGLVMVRSGSVGGDASLGWGDPSSDFFAVSAQETERQVDALLSAFPRVWQYRIYDTVTDPNGVLRSRLDVDGQLALDRLFAGLANMRLQSIVPRMGVPWGHGSDLVSYDSGLSLRWQPIPKDAMSGGTLYPILTWRPTRPVTVDIATSLRLLDSDGASWEQPPDEHPLGPLYTSSHWKAGIALQQPAALPVPWGTPPGKYVIELVVYDPARGRVLAVEESTGGVAKTRDGIALAEVVVSRAEPPPALQPALAQFGPVALVRATSPASVVSAGDEIPVELLWQSVQAPQEPLIVVLQLLDKAGHVVAGLEEQPLKGSYPTQQWGAYELLRDRHTLGVPTGVAAGDYRLVVGLYSAADGTRLTAQAGPGRRLDYYVLREVSVRD